jgi:hypothetical protein
MVELDRDRDAIRASVTQRLIHLLSSHFCRAIEYSSILQLLKEELGAET